MALVIKNLPANMQEREEIPAPPPGQEDPLEEAWLSRPALLPGEPHGQRSLLGISPWGRKELDTTEATQHACRSNRATAANPAWRSNGQQPDGKWGETADGGRSYKERIVSVEHK